jgi:hypothetical protein
MPASQMKTQQNKNKLCTAKTLHTRTPTAQLTSHWARSNTPMTNIIPTFDVPQMAVGFSLAHSSCPSTYNRHKKEQQCTSSNSANSICNQISPEISMNSQPQSCTRYEPTISLAHPWYMNNQETARQGQLHGREW